MVKSILVLGADAEVRNVLFEPTELPDYSLQFYDSPERLEQMTPESREHFIVVLVDVSHLPLCSAKAQAGIRAIRNLCPASRVILLSRWADETIWIEAIREGVYDVLAKPLDSREFRRVVLNAIQSYHRGPSFR
jgi:DNA-binding NtrC family response regulator